MSEGPGQVPGHDEARSPADEAVVADTHVVLWGLYLPGRLTAAAAEAVDGAATVWVSAITLVELAYLIDKGRFDPAVLDQVIAVLDDSNNTWKLQPITPRIAGTVRRVSRREVPDMPDRIIAATALELEIPLVTADGRIRASSVETIW